jgi:hypothetical protein
MGAHSRGDLYVDRGNPELLQQMAEVSVISSTLDGAVAERSTEANERRADVSPPGQKTKIAGRALPALARAFLDKIIRLQLLNAEAAEDFLKRDMDRVAGFTGAKELGDALVAEKLLTQYQFDRFLAGRIHGLVLGNHRVLDRLGAGGMGVVFLAEHIYMKRQVAVKVLPIEDDSCPSLLSRFYAEMHVLASLHHPHIVTAFDSGHVPSPDGRQPALLYLAMELVEGGDLESYVYKHGAADIGTACAWIAQAAAGLQEAHDHHLIHRDIKPSNLLLTREKRIKVVDFGLAQQSNLRQTTRGSMLGTIDFMPPEQSLDSSSVGGAADIYGLGATLFWLLTKEPPYPRARTLREAVEQLQASPARLIRGLRPDVSPELEAFIHGMLERDPARRPALPLTVSRILGAFGDCRNALN